MKAERDDLSSKVQAAQQAEAEWKSKHDALQQQSDDAKQQLEENAFTSKRANEL